MDRVEQTGHRPALSGWSKVRATGLTRSGQLCLGRLLGTLRVFDPQSPPIRVPLAGLHESDRNAIDALLGRGERRVRVARPPVRAAHETALAGVWRGRVLSEAGESLFDWLEVGEVPGFVREQARPPGWRHAGMRIQVAGSSAIRLSEAHVAASARRLERMLEQAAFAPSAAVA